MQAKRPIALAEAAEVRRRELPASIATIILAGGLAAAVLGSSTAVAWAGLVAILLVADMHIYRRLDANEARIEGRALAGLAGWSILSGAIYAALPLALWLDGEAAGAVAAMTLWIAGALRQFGPGASGAIWVAIAGAAPNALCIVIAPALTASLSAGPDWDAAVIATLAGIALVSYACQSRWRAEIAAAEARSAIEEATHAATLVQLAHSFDVERALLVDMAGRVRAITEDARKHLAASLGVSIEDAVAWPAGLWDEALKSVAIGEHVIREPWQARPWRDASGAVVGALVTAREAHATSRAAHSEPMSRRA